MTVNADGDGWKRSLNLVRSDQDMWSSNTKEIGTQPLELPTPGAVLRAGSKSATHHGLDQHVIASPTSHDASDPDHPGERYAEADWTG